MRVSVVAPFWAENRVKYFIVSTITGTSLYILLKGITHYGPRPPR